MSVGLGVAIDSVVVPCFGVEVTNDDGALGLELFAVLDCVGSIAGAVCMMPFFRLRRIL